MSKGGFPGSDVLDPPDPLSVFPHGSERGEIARVEQALDGGKKTALPEIVPGITGADRHKLEHARIPITVDHASRAPIADQLRRIELVNVAHGCLPIVTPVEVQIPVQVEIFVAAQAAESLRLPSEVALHFRERLHRV